jgi:acyl carrier protein
MMNRLQIEQTVIQVVKAAIIEDNESSSTSVNIELNGGSLPRSNFGLTSLGMADCISVLEHRLGVTIPSDDTIFVDGKRERTIAEIIDLLSGLITKKEEREWTLFTKPA